MYFLTYSVIFFSGILFFYNKKIGVILYAISIVLLAYLIDGLLDVADIRWYRQVVNDIDPENFLILILQNDFEFLWFLIVLIGKHVLGMENFGLGLCSFFIYSSILISKKGRDNIPLFSAFMLYPGSFLLHSNVIRQGYSEYMLIFAYVLNSYLLLLCAGLFHRFSLIFICIKYVIDRTKRVWITYVLCIVMIIGLPTFKDLVDIGVYDQLNVSYMSLLSKFFLYSLPLIFGLMISNYKIWRENNYVKSSVLIILLGIASMILHPRIADRIVFYLLPLALLAYFDLTKSKPSFKIFFLVIAFFMSLGAYFLDSYQEFFDVNVSPTEEIKHDK